MEERSSWTERTFLDAERSREAWRRMATLGAEWRVDAAVTLDGSYLPEEPQRAADGTRPPRAARAGLWSDGACDASAMWEGQDSSSYLPEFAAQLDAAARCSSRRLLVVHDATSPMEALVHFLREHQRRRADFYMDHWLDAWCRRLAGFEVVVFFHCKSHRGIYVNEIADVLAKAALASASRPVQVVRREHVSISFPGAGGATTTVQRVVRAATARVLVGLREACADSQWPRAGDTECRPEALSRRQWDVLFALRCQRWFPADMRALPGDETRHSPRSARR